MANEKPLDLSTLQAGLKRYDDSLADVAKSGDYDDLVNKPDLSPWPLTDSGSGASVQTDGSGIFGVTGEGFAHQDGTPTPDSPVEIEVARGRNLLDPSKFEDNKYQNPSNGSYNITTSDTRWITGLQSVEGSMQYCISGAVPSYAFVVFYNSSNTAIGQATVSNGTFTTSSDTAFVCFSIDKSAMAFGGPLQLEAGSTPTPYVPYGYIGLDITANGQTTTTPIPLPSKGFAAALPDGTADALAIDSAGRWEWVGFVGEKIVSGTESLVNPQQYGDYRRGAIALPSTGISGDNANSLCTHSIADIASGYGTGQYNHYYVSAFYAFLFAQTTTNEGLLSAYTGAEIIYQLATPTTEHGYIELPELPNGATVSIPELEAIGVEWWVEGIPEIGEYGQAMQTRLQEQLDEAEQALSNVAITGDYDDLVNKPNLANIATSGDYNDLTGAPFEKTVVSNDTTHFYTLSSNDHVEQEEGDVWKTEIDGDFKTGLLLVIENSPELENMPTDYTEAIEVPSSILSVDVFLNVQQSIGSNITTRIFKNTLNERIIIFKYQDAYIIGDMNLDTGYITYKEEYITSSSPIGINVWQVKYTFKGTHIVWAPKNEDEKFEMFRIRDISTGLLEIAANDYVNDTETCPTINGYIPIGIIGYERMDVLVDARLYNDNTAYVRYSLHNATSSAIQANVHFIVLYTRSSFFREAY